MQDHGPQRGIADSSIGHTLRAILTFTFALALVLAVLALPGLVTAPHARAAPLAANVATRMDPPATASGGGMGIGVPDAEGREHFEGVFQFYLADPRGPLGTPAFQNCLIVSANGTSAQLLGGYVQVAPRAVLGSRSLDLTLHATGWDKTTREALPVAMFTPPALVTKSTPVLLVASPPSDDPSPWFGILDVTAAFTYAGREPHVDAASCST